MLLLYFAVNLALTLYNKAVLNHFPFPYALTALHAFCGALGSFLLLRVQRSRVPNLPPAQLLVLILFSVLYTLNIIVSNASLRLVTIPFHQVVRASTPFFTILLSAILLHKPCSHAKILALVPVVAGVGFATYGDYYFTPFGFFLTLLGTILAALKTVLTNLLLVKPSDPSPLILPTSVPPSTSPSTAPNDPESVTSISSSSPSPSWSSALNSYLSLAIRRLFPHTPSSPPMAPTAHFKDKDTLPLPRHHHRHRQFSPYFPSPFRLPLSFSIPKLVLSPLHLLYLLSPLAFMQSIFLAHVTGELDRVRWFLFVPTPPSVNGMGLPIQMDPPLGRYGYLWLGLNGVLAFSLNVVSFYANRRVGPLGMSVAANVKQVLTILSAVLLFNLTITPANALGIFLTLLGGAWYAYVEYTEKHSRPLSSSSSPLSSHSLLPSVSSSSTLWSSATSSGSASTLGMSMSTSLGAAGPLSGAMGLGFAFNAGKEKERTV